MLLFTFFTKHLIKRKPSVHLSALEWHKEKIQGHFGFWIYTHGYFSFFCAACNSDDKHWTNAHKTQERRHQRIWTTASHQGALLQLSRALRVTFEAPRTCCHQCGSNTSRHRNDLHTPAVPGGVQFIYKYIYKHSSDIIEIRFKLFFNILNFLTNWFPPPSSRFLSFSWYEFGSFCFSFWLKLNCLWARQWCFTTSCQSMTVFGKKVVE